MVCDKASQKHLKIPFALVTEALKNFILHNMVNYKPIPKVNKVSFISVAKEKIHTVLQAYCHKDD